METVWKIVVFMGAFVGMELFSWWLHKYVMHGMLWFIHRTHHEKQKGPLELNDLFSLGFGSLAICLMINGMEHFAYSFWAGLGITTYGIVYFILHDLFIHKRLDLKLGWKNKYLKGIAYAHRMHHKHRQKSKAESFGLLLVSEKYHKKAQSK